MQRPNRPVYLQLDLFVLLMIGLLILVMMAHLPSQWETVVEIVWAVLMIAGMGLWFRANWAALRSEERKQHAANKGNSGPQPNELERTIPLTSVQKRFLMVMQSPTARWTRDEHAVVASTNGSYQAARRRPYRDDSIRHKGSKGSTLVVSLPRGRSHAPKRTMHVFKRWLPLSVVVIVIIAAVIWLQQLHLAADTHEKILIGLVFVSYLALWIAIPRSLRSR
jgi:hypothetical protein